MAACVIADLEVTDDPGIAQYRKLVPATVEKYGGRIAVRVRKFEVLRAIGSPSGLSS